MTMAVSGEMRLRLYVWGSIVAGLVIDVVSLRAAGIRFDFGTSAGMFESLACYAAGFCVLYGLSCVVRVRSQNVFVATCLYRCAVFIEVVCQFIAFFIVYLVLSYVAAISPMPYQDRFFTYADAFLHLDWYGYVSWVESHSAIRWLLTSSYYSPLQQVLVAFMLLGLTGRYRRLFQVMMILICTSSICIVIAAVLPAQGFITYQHINPADFPHLTTQLGVGYAEVPIVDQLRAGSFHTLLLTKCVGLIFFPSFHAGLGVILIWTFSTMPWIRWPVVALNLCEIASTPVIGGHYFVDTIAGAAIAGCAVYLIREPLNNA